MKTYITAFPIDRELQQKLGIYSDGNVKSVSVARVLHWLIKEGYTEINSFVESMDPHNDPDQLETRLTIHCNKEVK